MENKIKTERNPIYNLIENIIFFTFVFVLASFYRVHEIIYEEIKKINSFISVDGFYENIIVLHYYYLLLLISFCFIFDFIFDFIVSIYSKEKIKIYSKNIYLPISLIFIFTIFYNPISFFLSIILILYTFKCFLKL